MNLHQIQKRILFDLLFAQTLRYSEIKPYDMDPTQFLFHLKQLIQKDLLTKLESGEYTLTNQGKEVANRLDIQSLEMSIQTKVTCVICCINDKNEYLIYKRLKNPYYGCYGFPTQKVLWGQDITKAAVEGLKEETNLIPQNAPEIFAIRHYKIYNQERELLEDKLMHGFLIRNPQGTLASNQEGEFFWADQKSIKQLNKIQDEFEDFYNSLNQYTENKQLTFKEISVTSINF